jgi:hypothetical protein
MDCGLIARDSSTGGLEPGFLTTFFRSGLKAIISNDFSHYAEKTVCVFFTTG